MAAASWQIVHQRLNKLRKEGFRSRENASVHKIEGSKVRVRTTLSQSSPGGTAESSPGRQSWDEKSRNDQSRKGRLKFTQDAILGCFDLRRIRDQFEPTQD